MAIENINGILFILLILNVYMRPDIDNPGKSIAIDYLIEIDYILRLYCLLL